MLRYIMDKLIIYCQSVLSLTTKTMLMKTEQAVMYYYEVQYLSLARSHLG